MNRVLPRPESVIELSMAALRKNLRFLRSTIGEDKRFYAVVKGNAYGHDIETFCSMLQRSGVERYAVSSSYEALRVLRVAPEAREIMVMYAIEDDELEWAVEHGVSFWVFTPERLEAAAAAAGRVGRPARVHLELETGLHRNGLQGERLERVVRILQEHPGRFVVEGTCTHFAGAESVANHLRIQNQSRRFGEMVEGLRGRGVDVGCLHAACSAAALNYPESVLGGVRFGIALYGFWSSQETEMNWLLRDPSRLDERHRANPLRRVMRWSSRVMAVNEVAAGEFVGYGTSFQTQRRSRMATVPIGYSHGFPRRLSNHGHMLVRGKRAPVVGVVNMNLSVVDVTDVPGVAAGDEAVVIGRQGRRSVTVGSFSDLVGDLNYEVLLRISADIPRVVVS